MSNDGILKAWSPATLPRVGTADGWSETVGLIEGNIDGFSVGDGDGKEDGLWDGFTD